MICINIEYLKPIDRKKLILDEIKNNKIATKQYLADKFYVSSKTIERDIKKLIQMGYKINVMVGRGGGYTLKM